MVGDALMVGVVVDRVFSFFCGGLQYINRINNYRAIG
jgi:hypothetical protein